MIKQRITNTSMGAKIIWEKDIKKFLTKEQISTSISLAEKVEKSFKSKDMAIDIGLGVEDGKAYCFETNFFPGRNIPEKLYAYEIQKNMERLK